MVEYRQSPEPDPKPPPKPSPETAAAEPAEPVATEHAETVGAEPTETVGAEPPQTVAAELAESDADIVMRWLMETLSLEEENAAEGNWEADGWDEDIYRLVQRDYGIPPRVVKFFARWLPVWAADSRKRNADTLANLTDKSVTGEAVTGEAVKGEDGLDEQGVWEDIAEELADAAGTWVEFDPPETKSAEQHRYDLTKLLLMAPCLVSIVLLAMVAFADLPADDAAILAAALLGPLYIPLGVAIAYHYNKPSA